MEATQSCSTSNPPPSAGISSLSSAPRYDWIDIVRTNIPNYARKIKGNPTTRTSASKKNCGTSHIEKLIIILDGIVWRKYLRVLKDLINMHDNQQRHGNNPLFAFLRSDIA